MRVTCVTKKIRNLYSDEEWQIKITPRMPIFQCATLLKRKCFSYMTKICFSHVTQGPSHVEKCFVSHAVSNRVSHGFHRVSLFGKGHCVG